MSPVENWTPSERSIIMRTHTFANLMLTFYEILELNAKSCVKTKVNAKTKKESIAEAPLNMRDQRELSDFSSHQLFFAGTELDGVSLDGYNKIINIIDNLHIINHDSRRSLLYKYEQLYNALISTPVFTLVQKEVMVNTYTSLIIPAILALDMNQTLKQIKKDRDLHFYHPIQSFLLSDYFPKDEYDSKHIVQGVKKYLKQYIKDLEFHPEIDFNELYKYIDNIRVGINQKKDTIRGYINIYKSKTKKLLPSQVDKFDRLNITYTALNALLTFQNKTGLLQPLSMNCRILTDEKMRSSSLLSILNVYLYSFDYNTILLRECIETILYYANFPAPDNTYTNTESAINTLKNVVFENSFETEKTSSQFSLVLPDLKNWFNESKAPPLLIPYFSLMIIIDLLRSGKHEEAYEYINTKITFNELPFGYLASAIAIINIALKIKLKKNIIKNGSLIPIVNTILNAQGIFTDVLPYYPGMSNNPIMTNANNFTIMRSVRLYNTMIGKIIPTDNYNDNKPDRNYVSNLLDNLEEVLKKINTFITNSGEKITSEILADSIIKDKILTQKNINSNLISILSQSTIFNCVICLMPIGYYLGTIGEEEKLCCITELCARKYKRDLVYNALLIVEKKLSYRSIPH